MDKTCNCRFFSECNIINGGCCSHPEASKKFGTQITLTICEICPWYTGPSRGLGDDVHKIARVTGLNKLTKVYEKVTRKPCKCQERRARWNRKYRRPG